VPVAEATEGLKELENQLFLMTIKTMLVKNIQEYVSEEFQMEGDPTLFEEAIRSDHSLKCLEAMQDEMKSMNTNDV
jgi:hypothetical protein